MYEILPGERPNTALHPPPPPPTLGVGYTSHVLPSSSDWACPVQAWADQLGLLWVSQARGQRMCCVPSALPPLSLPLHSPNKLKSNATFIKGQQSRRCHLRHKGTCFQIRGMWFTPASLGANPPFMHGIAYRNKIKSRSARSNVTTDPPPAAVHAWHSPRSIG